VYYAVANYREFYWVSRPEAIHSRNIKTRPEIGIVIFDSSAPIGTGQGVYMNAVAEELQAAEHVVAINIFSRRSLEQGGVAWTVDDVRPPSELRLYRATALAHFVLGSHDERLQVRL
jgi:hypothetical protein